MGDLNKLPCPLASGCAQPVGSTSRSWESGRRGNAGVFTPSSAPASLVSLATVCSSSEGHTQSDSPGPSQLPLFAPVARSRVRPSLSLCSHTCKMSLLEICFSHSFLSEPWFLDKQEPWLIGAVALQFSSWMSISSGNSHTSP